jgi:hypothetical protein
MENLLDWEIHNCWVLFHKECVFCESLKQTRQMQMHNLISTSSYTRY